MARFAFAGLIALASSALLASGADISSREDASLEKRTTQTAPLIGCYPGGAGGCPCPKDKNGDSGVLINFFPGYQCAYPDGACSWDDQDGSLQNQAQTNCPRSAPCPSTGCTCPLDLNNSTGVLINYFTGYQCAYPHGACTWDSTGALANTAQTNCPSSAVCNALVGKPPPPKNPPHYTPNFRGIWFFLPWW